MVSPLAVAAIVFGCVFGGALVGMVLRDRLPKDHLGPETKDLVKLGVGLIRISSGSLRSALANLGR